MQMIVNGDVREATERITLADYLGQLKLTARMVVVERNGSIIPREQFSATQLTEGDVLEIVQMMAGG